MKILDTKVKYQRHRLIAAAAVCLCPWWQTATAAEQGHTQESVPANSLDQLRIESQETANAFFSNPDQVIVKPPVLQALITLNRNLSPYGLDSRSSRQINLAETLQEALGQNLDIKISNTDWKASRWQYIGALGGFLPNLVNGFSYQQLTGKFASPFGLMAHVDSPYINAANGVQWYFFKGGGILYGARRAFHTQKAKHFGLQETSNDILFEADNAYYQLVLNDILLQIRVKAVETSKALLLRNQIEFENGAVTKLDVLEAKAQLSRDRQALINQQVARRQAAIKLARLLNDDSAADLTAADRSISKVRLVDENAQIGDLLQVAIDNRPELRKHEQLRLAAKDAVKVAFASLLPQVFGAAGGITTAARVSSSSSAAGSSAAAGGPLAGGSFGGCAAAPAGSSSSARKFAGAELLQFGIVVQWNLGGLGLTEAAQVQSARYEARKAQLEFNRKLSEVIQEVRDAYLESLDSEQQIIETTDAVNATAEQLSVATVRLEESVGTDLEVVHAQRDFTDALISKAEAIIKFNVAQAKLLRAMGRISLPTLTAVKPLVK
jgi:outer membrane protein TolC